MVRFGLLEHDIDDHGHSEMSVDPAASDNSEPGEDTFAYRDNHDNPDQIPGSFYYSSSCDMQAPFDTALELSTRELRPLDRQFMPGTPEVDRDNLFISHPKSDISHKGSASIADGSSASVTQQLSSLDGSTIHLEACSRAAWPIQLSQVNKRFEILQKCAASGAMLPSTRRMIVQESTEYTALELDNDLFRLGKKHESNRTRELQTPSTSGEVRATPATRRTTIAHHSFLFRWSSARVLLKKNLASCEPKILGTCTQSRKQCQVHILSELLKQSDIELSTSGIPHVKASNSLTASSMLTNTMSQVERSLWHLACALFDPLNERTNESSREYDHATNMRPSIRKKAVSSWLQTSVSDSVREEAAHATAPEETILCRLSGHQLDDACAAALSAGQVRLATLIPLAGGDRGTRQDLERQIDAWTKTEMLSYINLSYRQVYSLLGGDVSKILMSKHNSLSHMSFVRTLDWQRTFGLYLWYGTPEESSIEGALRLYQAAMPDMDLCSQPIIEQDAADSVLDVRYHLLNYFVDQQYDLRVFLDARTLKEDCWNNDITAWVLFRYLQRKQAASPDFISYSVEQDQSVIAVCTQLEATGCWQWAVFVALHISSNVVRENLLRRLLARHIESVTEELELFLRSILKIPRSWILEAQALSLRAQGLFEREARCLIKAGLANEAHTSIVERIAPQGIISGHPSAAYEFLSMLDTGPTIHDWKHGGLIYKDAIEVLQFASDINQESMHMTGLHVIHDQISRLGDALPLMKQNTFEQRVAKAQISSILARVLLNATSGARMRVIASYSRHNTGQMADLRQMAIDNCP